MTGEHGKEVRAVLAAGDLDRQQALQALASETDVGQGALQYSSAWGFNIEALSEASRRTADQLDQLQAQVAALQDRVAFLEGQLRGG